MEEIIIVGCLGRSGSTLLMRMLEKGGISVVASDRILYEDMRAWRIQKNNADWLGECKGRAIKVVDLYRFDLPDKFKYKVIYLKRDYCEQAKSYQKWLEFTRPDLKQPPDFYIKALNLFPQMDKQAFEKLKHNKIPFITITFEDLITETINSLNKIKSFLGVDIDTDKAIEIVKDRSPKCLPNSDIETAYAKERGVDRLQHLMNFPDSRKFN